MDTARYTVMLKTLLDDLYIKEKIDKALSTYPLYVKRSKEEYIPSLVPTREELNKKILDYYKYREIGFDTIARFIDELEIAMCEIMPRYNQLYLTIDQDYDMRFNVDYTRETQAKRDGKTSNLTEGSNQNTVTSTETSKNTSSATDHGTTTASGTDNAKNVKSDTPQSELNVATDNINGVSYADTVSWNQNKTSSETEQNGTTSGETNIQSNGTDTSNGTNTIDENGTKEENEEVIEKIRGNYGQVSFQSLISAYRDLIVNVEQQIIRDKRIQELFMLVY